jgi:hypothetical protein
MKATHWTKLLQTSLQIRSIWSPRLLKQFLFSYSSMMPLLYVTIRISVKAIFN